MLVPSPRRPIVLRYRRPWRRVVPVVRALHARRVPVWEIASRLRITRDYVKRALRPGGGTRSPEEWGRMCAAVAAEAGR